MNIKTKSTLKKYVEEFNEIGLAVAKNYVGKKFPMGIK
jgi:hypothetical protein